MPRQISLPDLAAYHSDAEASLRLYFTEANPAFLARFFGFLPSEVRVQLNQRIEETDLRSALAVLARIEAAFRIDYLHRCDLKKTDSISVKFRAIHKNRGKYVRLDEDIWETWRAWDPSLGPIIGHLRGAFKFRHWVAHGRYWRTGRKYDFQTTYQLATIVFGSFPLHG